MRILFATSNPKTALAYMQEVEPSKNHTKESAKGLLTLVAAGVLRVGDPSMYKGKAPIFPGDCYVEDMKGTVMDVVKELADGDKGE